MFGKQDCQTIDDLIYYISHARCQAAFSLIQDCHAITRIRFQAATDPGQRRCL